METITAKEAKHIADGTICVVKLSHVFDLILEEAEKGNTVLELNDRLSQDSIQKLKELGYEMPPVGQSIIRHSIHW